jgi:ParB/RepB/Spo0J family partition protein
VESYENPIEKAMEYERIMKDESLTQSALAEKMGISRVRINQYLNLLKIPKERIDYILENGKRKIITERQLRKTFNSNSKPYIPLLESSAQALTEA